MHLTADLLLAFRYLRPKRTFISVITLLSVLGPVLGVAILIIVTSVMSGFDHDIRQRILGMQAHVHVRPVRPGHIIENPEPLLAKMAEVGIQGAPIVEGPVLLQLEGTTQIKMARGILPELERKVTALATTSGFIGRFDVKEGEVLIGSEMARLLGLGLGDELLLHAPQKLTSNIKWGEDGEVKIEQPDEIYLPEEVTVVGIFTMGVWEYDSGLIFLHLHQAADLFGYDWGSAMSIHGSVPDPFRMDEPLAALREKLPLQRVHTRIADGYQERLEPKYRVLSWQQENQMLFSTLRVEKTLMVFLLTFIVVVASFGIAGTLITLAVQKTREIGIMKAMGMSRWMVARIFLLLGAVIGTLGTALGTVTGLLVIHYRNHVADLLSKLMGADVFPPELYHLMQIPGRPMPGDVALIVALSILICTLASLIPALYASALSPARALREDN
ncbi:MAG: ABC transporter permease [Victivallales bacterium]|jgi:lipoprotein-releasing system permease protein|nr:ABC transporter permease [Victivallales bacterium]MBT7164844.1 ABC transporter permease [Victivallales bacterium]MBT7298583.1 ABC transporter permease [Victivallales bacterium]